MDCLTNAVSAFEYAMEKHGIPYDFYNLGKKKLPNFSNALSGNHLVCQTSAYLFIQFGRELGLDLIGVYLTALPPSHADHFVVAYRQDGKITHYIETTKLLVGMGCTYLKSASELSKMMSEHQSRVLLDGRMLKLLDGANDSAQILSMVKDSVCNFYIKQNGWSDTAGFGAAADLEGMKCYCRQDSIRYSFSKQNMIGASCGISAKEFWEATNKGMWESIEYIEADDLE